MTRKKFVPLFTESGTGNRLVVLLPGRHPCQCLAVRHRLIGNCTGCGRIVCEQEGSGCCYFCGNLVLSAEERKYAESDTNASRKCIARIRSTPWAPGTPPPPWTITRNLRRRYGNRSKVKATGEESEVVDCEQENSLNELEHDEEKDWIEEEAEIDYRPDTDAQGRLEEGLVKALVQRDRLLHFDATTAKRTRVIDDEVDYFMSDGGGGSSALWLDPQTRARVAQRVEELRAQRRALRSQTATALTIDFTSRTAFEQVLPTEEDLALLASSGTDKSNSMGISDPLLNIPVPQSGSVITKKRVRDHERQKQQQSRVQDADQQKIEDHGFCLSMHQPWASLLVRGVKIHEGRSWYSSHRGPLWIAAAAKRPDDEEVRVIEAEYLRCRGARQADFPSSYPTGVLLGCVNVDEVLPQKEYRLKFPDGESESPYVFVCSDPRELLIKLPMSGQHKIYRIDPHIHAAAKENLT